MASSRLVCRLSSRLKPFALNSRKPSLASELSSPSLPSRSKSTPNSRISRLPVQLSSIESMMPLHSAVASARLISSLSVDSEKWGLVPQGSSRSLRNSRFPVTKTMAMRSPRHKICVPRFAFIYQAKRGLVNVKLKWAKDKTLDAVVKADEDVKAASTLVSVISSAPRDSLPIYHLSHHRGQLGLPDDLKLSTFLRRYPSVFHESRALDSAGTCVPCFGLTCRALELRREELRVLKENQTDVINRLRKLLMLTRDRMLPLQTLNQLQWDLGLPYDYPRSLIPRDPTSFLFVNLPDDRVGLKLNSWDVEFAVSKMQERGCVAFPVGFTRGFGLKRKCAEWLKEFQELPYTSPYSDPSRLDPRTDESEKRAVGVFHELLYLTITKKTERKNVSNLRRPLSLPQKFTKVFERHPGIFYISKKCDSQTVVLREGYDGQRLVQGHPLVDVRDGLRSLLREGRLDRSRGVYKNRTRSETESVTSECDGTTVDLKVNGYGSPSEEFDPY